MAAEQVLDLSAPPPTRPMHAGTGTVWENMRGLPTPYRDQELYDAVTTAGFNEYPERYENLQRYNRAQRGEVVDYLPIQMDIENVSRCNFRCTMCQVSKWHKGKRSRDMTLQEFKDLVEQQFGLIEIKLQGMGEPLLAGDVFFEMIRYARERHIWVRTTVNGSLLHLNDNYKKLIDSDVCEVHISIDAPTKETFEAIRHGSKFERVTKNARLLNDYAKSVGKHRTRMWGVVQRSMFHALDQMPKLAADLGFARLSLSLDLNDWGQDTWREFNDTQDMQDAFDLDTAHRLRACGEELGVEVTFFSLDEKFDTSSPETLCHWPFERLYIASDMRVVPCCMIANPDVMEIGSAYDIGAMWNSQVMRDFRGAHLSGAIPDICKSCYKHGGGSAGE